MHKSFSSEVESNLVRKLFSGEDILVNLVYQSQDQILGNIIISKTNVRVMEGWVLSPYYFGPAEYFLMASWIKMLNKYELQS